MAAVTTEVCANCGGMIGKLETPHLFNGHIVCGACIARLRPQDPAPSPPQPLGYATPIPAAIPTPPPPPRHQFQTPPVPPPPTQPHWQPPPVVVQMPPQRKWSPGVAALLSFVIPGAGQMYKGDVGIGVLWCIGTFIGYFMFVLPGIILHLVCVFTAASGDPYK